MIVARLKIFDTYAELFEVWILFAHLLVPSYLVLDTLLQAISSKILYVYFWVNVELFVENKKLKKNVFYVSTERFY